MGCEGTNQIILHILFRAKLVKNLSSSYHCNLMMAPSHKSIVLQSEICVSGSVWKRLHKNFWNNRGSLAIPIASFSRPISSCGAQWYVKRAYPHLPKNNCHLESKKHNTAPSDQIWARTGSYIRSESISGATYGCWPRQILHLELLPSFQSEQIQNLRAWRSHFHLSPY